MELGNEIGQKIRSAIKAKLVDLGAYVDDELPDYVMVMVANKKTQNQMIDDLNLFLGNNTAKFTTWLHGLLEKLLSITLIEENKKLADTDTNKMSIKDNTKSKVKSIESAIKKDQKDGTKVDKKENNLPVVEKRKLDKKFEEDVNMLDDDKPVLKISAEQDEFENENLTQDIVKAKKRKLSERDNEAVRRTIVSKVSSVVNLKEDKLKPPSANLSSVVTVTERKSSLPDTMQPSKVLLMKAMQQAERSVTLIKQKLNSENKLRENESSDLNVRLLNRRRQKTESNNMRYSKNSHLIDSDGSKRAKRVHENKYRSRSRSKRRNLREGKGDRDKMKAVSSDRDDIEFQDFASKGNQEKINSKENKIIAENGVVPNDDKKDSDVEIIGTEMSEIRRVRKLEVNCSDEGAFGQNRMVMLKKIDDVGGNDEEEDSETTDEDVVRVGHRNFISREANKRKDDSDDASKLRKMLIKQKSDKSKPRFIVTMNSSMQVQKGMLVQSEGSDPMGTALNETQMLEYVTGHATDIQLTSVQVPEEKKEKIGWSCQRCKFWPSCKNGDACLFEHPNIQCKTFPNCRFGENCLFIHPPCKFASACTNAHCIYAHDGQRNILSALPSVQDSIAGPPRIIGPRTQGPVKSQNFCKFFPNCFDMDCKFIHPKPCRFGVGCHQKNICPFNHPYIPSLKWQAG